MISKWWHRLFLEERPSISLAFFRVAVAVTTGCHVIPTFFQLGENYYSMAFKTFNPVFFPVCVIEFIQKSPDSLVLFFVFVFLMTWFFFLIGLFTQINCILMVLACYYFYALNSFYIGTLSWDILLVTLFLICVTPYPGDYFSLDCLRRGDVTAYKKTRPFFLQRLLQMQIAWTYFYTALYKISPPRGDWLKDNPIYYLMNYPVEGVTKTFLLKDFFSTHPHLCYWTGISIVVCELLMPFLLFYNRTRNSAIILGIFFHVVLILTFDVPAIFFFLFPTQLLLFIDPNKILRVIENKRLIAQKGVRSIVVYDGKCGFCRRSVHQLQIMDLFNALKMIDFNAKAQYGELFPGQQDFIRFDSEGRMEAFLIIDLLATKEKEKVNNNVWLPAKSQLHLIEPDGSISGGYFVFRRISWKLPMVYPFIPVLYFPGSGIVGPMVYRWVAKNRYLFHSNKTCQNNYCFIPKV